LILWSRESALEQPHCAVPSQPLEKKVAGLVFGEKFPRLNYLTALGVKHAPASAAPVHSVLLATTIDSIDANGVRAYPLLGQFLSQLWYLHGRAKVL
jgi:hypothetical protein